MVVEKKRGAKRPGDVRPQGAASETSLAAKPAPRAFKPSGRVAFRPPLFNLRFKSTFLPYKIIS